MLGVLPEFGVPFPYWQEVPDVVTACAERFGIDVVLLRLLSVAVAPNGAGGPITYLAQVRYDAPLASVALEPWRGSDPLVPHPLRASYASPGGPQADLGWARRELGALGRTVAGTATQLRTWNLSSIWRIPTSGGPVWLKVVPELFAHEPDLLRLLAQEDPSPGPHPCVPTVLASSGGRELLEDIPGQDHYGAGAAVVADAIDSLVRMQAVLAAHLPRLASMGLLDRRCTPVYDASVAVAERYRELLSGDEARALGRLADSLPRRYAQAQASGIPDSLVHGDFHPGNVRGEPGRLRILDWGDAYVGPPALDLIRLRGVAAEADRPAMTGLWVQAWRRRVPESDPARAIEPLAPVAELIGAITYQRFLDHIEPDEAPYHAADPLACLKAAAAGCA